MRDFENVYVPEKGSLPWFAAWGYDLQGAIYQEVVYQNIGKRLPFELSAATKEKTTDIDIVRISQKDMDFELENFCNNVELYDAMKSGIIAPERCEKCEYCKNTKVLTEAKSSDDFYLI